MGDDRFKWGGEQRSDPIGEKETDIDTMTTLYTRNG